MQNPSRLCTFILLMICSGLGCTQPPLQGRLEGHTYINPSFHFGYSWPETLQPVDPASLNLHAVKTQDEFLLFSAQQGTAPFGLIVLAERLAPSAEHPIGWKNGEDFLSRIEPSWEKAGNGKVLARTHFLNSHGLPFDEFDYLYYGEYTAALTTKIDAFLIVFEFNAKTDTDLKKMVQSIQPMRLVE